MAGSHGPAAGGAHGGMGDRGGTHSAFGGYAPRAAAMNAPPQASVIVRTRANGRVSDVHDARRGMDVHHGLNGGRRVSRDMPGHGRIVSERGRRGYVQRGYGYHGHDFNRGLTSYHGQLQLVQPLLPWLGLPRKNAHGTSDARATSTAPVSMDGHITPGPHPFPVGAGQRSLP